MDNTVRKISSIPPTKPLPKTSKRWRWHRCALAFVVAWVLWWYVIARIAIR